MKKGHNERKTVGYIVGGHGELKGSSEVAYAIETAHQNKGIGGAAMGLLMYHLEELYNKKSLVNNAPFTTIVATSREDNVRSSKMLKKVGFEITGQSEKYNSKRYEWEYRFIN